MDASAVCLFLSLAGANLEASWFALVHFALHTRPSAAAAADETRA